MPSLQLNSTSDQNGAVDSPSLSQRRIDFHLARKPFSASPNTCNFKLVTLNPSKSPPSNSPLTRSSSNKPSPSDFVDSALDAELSLRISFQRIGAGLENLGNTCYLNSVIQCLTYTEPLVSYLQSGRHQHTCHIAGFCALCAIHKHVNRALQSTGRIVAPKDLVSNLRCISRNFRNARQEDAHEYMIHLLESMHKCCLPSGVLPESPGAYDKSLVYKIFGGRLRSQVKCLQCSYCSNTFDPFLDLSLEILKADSLHKALTHFTATEQLDGGERQYKCERCKQKVKAVKQLTIHKAPYVLGVHLKRFRSYLAEKKIDKKVHFGTSLDLKPFVSGPYEGDMVYKLYGVLVHAGWSTRSGHYYCFVHTSSGLWYSLDDRRVVQVSERSVLDQKAYMLFYVRDTKNYTPKKTMDVIQKENFMPIMQNVSSSCSMPVVHHQQQQQQIQQHQHRQLQPSNVDSAVKGLNPDPKLFHNNCADKNASKGILYGFIGKDSESSKADKVLAQQNVSESAIKPSSDSGIDSQGVPESKMDTLSFVDKSKPEVPSSQKSLPMKSSGRTVRRKLMKNMYIAKVLGMHFSTKMLYGASLSLRKKRKRRKMKHSDENPGQEPLLSKDIVTVDPDPSSSDRISNSIDCSMDSHMNGTNSCPIEREKDAAQKCSVSSGSNNILNPFRELEKRNTCTNTVLTNGKLPPESIGDSIYPKQVRSQLQNGVNVTGAGRLEIAVGRWEGVESPTVLESNGQNCSIGYILDDWDEDYDLGRRKKLRLSRNNFDGPNPFQEIALKKAKLKGRTDAANQPFRI